MQSYGLRYCTTTVFSNLGTPTADLQVQGRQVQGWQVSGSVVFECTVGQEEAI